MGRPPPWAAHQLLAVLMLKEPRKEFLVALAAGRAFCGDLWAGLRLSDDQDVPLSFTDAPLIGEGSCIGLENYGKLLNDNRMATALWNTAYFVLLSVMPGTAVALLIALGVSRLKGRLQAAVLALFFLPYILPVSVVYLIWDWVLNFQFGIAMHVLDLFGLQRIPVFKTATGSCRPWPSLRSGGRPDFRSCCFSPGCAPSRWKSTRRQRSTMPRAGQVFHRITWPLLWPVTALVFTIQLILQLKIFDQVYLFSIGGRPNDNAGAGPLRLSARLPA